MFKRYTISGQDDQSENRRPTIQINKRHLRDVRSDVVKAILALNDTPTVFVSDGRICKIVRLRNGISGIKPLTVESLGNIASRAADYVRADKNDDTEPAFLTAQICRDILYGADPDLAFPRLNGITESPLVSSEGKIECEPGYLPGTEMYFAPPEGESFEVERLKPTDTNVQRALKELFGYLLEGFKFGDSASKPNSLAFALLPIVRLLINGPTPLTVVDAPVPSTGKTKLVETLGAITNPARLSTKVAPHEDAEWRKAITSTLIKGNQHVWFDNLKGRVNSGSLCIALTTTVWSDRLLGQNEDLILPNLSTWVATGNNVNLDEEVASRSVFIRLDTKMERPDLRTGFKCPSPPFEVRNRRAHYLGLLLCLVEYWIEKGMPRYTGTAVSRYPEWLSVMGGLLDTVGVHGLIGNYEQRTQATNPTHEAWTAFVARWGTVHSTNAVTVREGLVEFAFGSLNAYGQVDKEGPLLDVLRCSITNRPNRLGKALDERVDRVFGEWRIVRGALRDGNTTYRLERA